MMSDVNGSRRYVMVLWWVRGVGGGGGVDKGFVDMRALLRWDSRNRCNLHHFVENADGADDGGGDCATVVG